MDWVAPLLLRLDDPGPWAVVLFLALYVAVTLVLAPAFLLTIAAGAVFGLWQGTLLVLLGAFLGSSAAFFLGSRLARTRVQHWMDRDHRVAAVRQAVVGQGARVILLLRLSPLVPYVLLNYALAVSGVRYRDFAVATVGMLPAIVMYVYYGRVIGDVAAIAAGVAPPRGAEYYVLLVVGLAATIVATTLITRAARNAVAAKRSGV